PRNSTSIPKVQRRRPGAVFIGPVLSARGVDALRMTLRLEFPMRILMLAAALATAATVQAQPANERPEDRWNLEALYPTVAAFNDDLAKMETQLPQIAACKGTLGQSAARLKSCMDLQYEVLRRYLRLLVYASEKANEDTGNADALALRQKIRIAQSGYTEAVSFV